MTEQGNLPSTRRSPGGLQPTSPSGRRRTRIVLAAAGALLLILAGIIAATILGDNDDGGILGDGDRQAAEQTAQDHMTAVVERDFQRECELESSDYRTQPTVQECVVEEADRSPAIIQGPVSVERSVELGQGRGYGVAVEYRTSDGESEVDAIQVVEEDGRWLVDSLRPLDEDAIAYATANGLDEIAVALEITDVPTED